MNAIEEKVYTLTDDALSIAADIYDALETIRYDPVGATPDDIERMKEIRGLLRQAAACFFVVSIYQFPLLIFVHIMASN